MHIFILAIVTPDIRKIFPTMNLSSPLIVRALHRNWATDVERIMKSREGSFMTSEGLSGIIYDSSCTYVAL